MTICYSSGVKAYNSSSSSVLISWCN
jgi:hypothetical protein